MNLNPNQIGLIVDKVLARLQNEAIIPSSKPVSGRGVFRDIDSAVNAAYRSFLELSECSLAKRNEMIENIRKVCREHVYELAKFSVEETKLGRVEDKIKKNLLVINKTPGTEILTTWAVSGDDGLTIEEFAPYGVICSITPVTNPTETIINNGIGMLAAGNTVTFNAHPSAKKVSAYCVSLLNDAIVSVGGPENVFTLIEEPTVASAQQLMRHPLISLVVVTGGPAVVKEAMSSGKKVIAAGPGNPPVVVDETADIKRAAEGIVNGASFDNNIICVDEKEVIVVDEVADMLKKSLSQLKTFEINKFQLRQLEKIIVTDGHPNKNFVGRNANVILNEIGIKAGDDLRLIIVETEVEHPFVQLELLMPVIPIVRARDADEAIAIAKKVEHNFRHTAVIYSTNIKNMHKMARVMNCSIFVKNAPAYSGLGEGGEGFTSFTIASPTGEGLTNARTFSRKRRCTLKEYFRIV